MQTFGYDIRYNILSVAHRELTEQMLVMVVVMMNELAQQVLMRTALHCCLSGEPTGARAQKKLFDPACTYVYTPPVQSVCWAGPGRPRHRSPQRDVTAGRPVLRMGLPSSI